MLTDTWVLAQLLAQLCALALLTGAALFSTQAIARWAGASHSELQLNLERRGYLIAAMVQLVMAFQMGSLVVFLITANQHLVGTIRGAMCATGALAANDFGYPALYLKMGGVLLYAAFLMLHYFDDAEPGYPLTPLKYWLIPPAWLLVGTDFYLMGQYFGRLSPDVITTCCSVSFLATRHDHTPFLTTGTILPWAFGLFGGGGGLLLLALWRNVRWWITALLTVAFLAGAVYSLKYFFVKYIYGLPSHTCLFDMFFPQYGGVGYLLFGAYYGLALAVLLGGIYRAVRPRLRTDHPRLSRRWRMVAALAVAVALTVPTTYWLLWPGSL